MVIISCWKHTIVNVAWLQNKMTNTAKRTEFPEVDESGVRNLLEFCKTVGKFSFSNSIANMPPRRPNVQVFFLFFHN